ncbi:MAG: hypothetical protein EBR82_66535 [Caulobacteraceae bacterium]|nr:hypothetical protein [Caulobacteraceae bacterium]
MNIQEKIDALKFEAILLREPKKAKSDNWHDTAHEWRIVINGQTLSYFTGITHREMRKGAFSGEHAEYKRLKNANLTDCEGANFIAVSKATPPSVKDVLYSLVMDSSACFESFDDWCANYGYETDSRKALETYLACQQSWQKLRTLRLGSVDELQEFFSDY